MKTIDFRAGLGKVFDVADKALNTTVNKVHSFFEQNDLPSVKISEDEKNYIVELAVPGYSQASVSTKVDGDLLVISGKTEKSKLAFYGDRDFSRDFVLPRGSKTDDISAIYVNGVLRVVIPLEEPPQVKITVG